MIDIFNAIIEICFIITVYYNDLIIEEYLEKNHKEKNEELNSNKISLFIHSKSAQSIKLLTILSKNCDLFSKHFNILIKPIMNKKDKEEIKRERKRKEKWKKRI